MQRMTRYERHRRCLTADLEVKASSDEKTSNESIVDQLTAYTMQQTRRFCDDYNRRYLINKKNWLVSLSCHFSVMAVNFDYGLIQLIESSAELPRPLEVDNGRRWERIELTEMI